MASKKTAPTFTAADLERAANQLGVCTATIAAVAEVESSGRGLLADGRPAILFERHVFLSRLSAAGVSAGQLDQLVTAHPDIVNRKRGGYLGGPKEWERLTRARAINNQAALESCSWGLFQIMGYHCYRLGYDSAEAFAEAMATGTGAHLDAFVRFIKADPALHRALRWHKWSEFARRYNGPAYAENHSDTKLAEAFAHHQELAANAG